MTGTRTFYVYTAMFAFGTFAAQFTPVLTPAWLALSAGACLIPGWWAPPLRPLVLLTLGVLWALFRADLVLQTEWPTALERRDVVLWGSVANLPERSERYMKFDLDVERARFKGEPVAFAGRVRLRWYDPSPEVRAALKAATTWRLQVRLKQPHGYYNPGGFDYEAYLFRERVRATGYVRESSGNHRTGNAPWSVMLAARQKLRDRFGASLAGLRHPGLLKALALGDRTAITDDEWRTFRATGTNHLVAISGLHIGIVAGLGGLLGLWGGRAAAAFHPGVSAPRVAAVVALGFAFGYAALSGFAVPAQRAFIMAAVFLLGVLCRRHAWTLRGLCVALLLVLIIHPASVHDPGLWLSFCAVGLIIGWLSREKSRAALRAGDGGPDRGRPGYWCRTGARVVAAVKLQWMLSLALVPLVVAFFSTASLVAAPANTLAVPVVVFVLVPLCLAAVTVTALGFQNIAGWCLGLADPVMAGLWTVLHHLGQLEYARTDAHLEFWQSLVILAGVLWIILARPGRRALWGLVAALVLLAPGPDTPERGEFRVTVLDVGQGLSVVVRTRQHTLVYDTGPRYPSGFSLSKAVVIPYLRARAIGSVDLMVVSHGDNDHRGGYEDLRAHYPPSRVLSSVAPELAGAEYCVEGQHWRWDGVDFDVLQPSRAGAPPHNNASCVLRISSPRGAMLLTGDIEAGAEEALVSRFEDQLHSDVLLVPHHGSETSSSPSFIDRVDPDYAVVSAGYANRYGHPRPAVKSRYRQRGITVRSTALSGAVTVSVSRRGIGMTGWRESRPRYWLDRSDAAHDDDAI